MQRDDNGKKSASDRDGPAMAIGDVTSQETDPLSSDDNSPSSEISSEGPPATAVVQDAEHSASGVPQPLHPAQRTEPASGGDAKGSNMSNQKKNMNLDLEPEVLPASKFPILSLGDETCPKAESGEHFDASVVPPNIPVVEIDSTRCLSSTVSTSEESLQCLEDKKELDHLEVNFSPGKRKTRTSPIKDKYDSDDTGNSESNPDASEKPRQKKSMLSRIIGREKSPLRKKEKSQLDLHAKVDKSSADSRSKRDKSPTNVKKNKSPKGSSSKLDKSPTRSQGKLRARSPSKIFGKVKDIFCKKTEDSKPLCETDSGETEDVPKKATKKEKGIDISKIGDLAVPDGFHIVSDLNFSDTTCDSTSTKFSRASISTDSPTSDAGNATRTNVPDRTRTNPKQKPETSNSESDDDKME